MMSQPPDAQFDAERDYWEARYAEHAQGAPDEAFRVDAPLYLERLGALENPSREPVVRGWHYPVSKGHLIRKGFDLLRAEGLEGKRVLELACGNGFYGTMLAQLGARVDGVDIAPAAIEFANRRARVNAVDDHATFHVMPAQQLGFDDATFDYAIGFDCLHHIHKYDGVASELKRVLKPGGRAVFVGEPLGENPLIELMRGIIIRLTHKQEAGETTVTRAELAGFGSDFQSMTIHEYGLFFQLKRFALNRLDRYPVRVILNRLYRLDAWLLPRFPALKRFCGEAVVEYRR